VLQAKACGVERLARKGLEGGADGVRKGPPPSPTATINGVAYERVPVGGQMDSNLMGAAGGETALQQRRRILENAEHAVPGDGTAAPAAHHRHGLAVSGVAADGTGDLAVPRLRHGPDDGEVGTLDPAS